MQKLVMKNAKRHCDVSRDDAGVPHIHAASWLDALYGLGYMHAQDRGTQVLFARAIASGQAAERIAHQEELLETDCFFRRIGLHLDLERETTALSPEVREQVDAYAAGVTDGIGAKRRSLPMWATGFQPEPWDAAAVMLVGRLLSFGGLAVSQLQNERLLIDLVHAGADAAALREMFEPRLDDMDFDLIRQVQLANRMSDEALEVLVDLPRLAGSNAWAVAPWRSATGRAILASDPHLEVNRLPAIWYEAVLQWGDEYVAGATLPGCPLFSVARTKKLSWGVTYLKGDTIDFFVEDVRQTEEGQWEYRREDRWVPFEVRRELVGRKGEAPLEMLVHENPNGSLEMEPTQSGYYLSVAWAGRQVSSAQGVATWLDLIHAPDVRRGMDIIRECTQPTLTFILADSQGYIGMQGCGAFPIRRHAVAGLAPLPAWEPENHWRGWHDTCFLPSAFDPPEGFVATANEESNPSEGPMLVTQTVNDYRLRRIRERLAELPQATIADMQTLQYDVVSTEARELLELFLPYLPDSEIKQRLSRWDYSYSVDSQEAPLFQRLYTQVMMELLGHDRGIGWRRMVYLCSRAGFSSMVLTAADRLLHRDQSWWWHGRDKGDLIRRAAAKLEGQPIAKTWGDVNNFHFANRFFGNHRVGRLLGYNSRVYPMPGCHATPFQGHVIQTALRESTFAPSYHFVTSFHEDRIWSNLPGGPSESRFSSFYRNDIPRWLTGEYKSVAPF
jgi:penicillin amidase